MRKKLIHPTLFEIIGSLFLFSVAQVKWIDSYSSCVSILSGVRQGGILSPLLFSIYIDEVLDILEASSLGCFTNYRCVNSFLYADDLILISPSVTGLQDLLSLAAVSFGSLGFEINPSKSCCLRIGNRCMTPCQNISVNGTFIPWVKEAKYLGVVFKSCKHLFFNWFEARGSYYRAINSILSSLGSNPPLDVIVKLVKTVCFPILSYGIAAVSLSSRDINSFTYAYNNIFGKIFKSFNLDTIAYCQYFCSCLPFVSFYDYLRFSFLSTKYNNGLLSNNYLDEDDYIDLCVLCEKYVISPSLSKPQVKFKLWSFVKSQLGV